MYCLSSKDEGLSSNELLLMNFYMFAVGRPCDTWMHYAMRDVKGMGQQMGYRSLEWNWPKEAMNRPIWASIVDGAKLF